MEARARVERSRVARTAHELRGGKAPGIGLHGRAGVFTICNPRRRLSRDQRDAAPGRRFKYRTGLLLRRAWAREPARIQRPAGNARATHMARTRWPQDLHTGLVRTGFCLTGRPDVVWER